MASENILESCQIAANRSVESWEKGAAGAGFSRSFASSRTSYMAVSAEESASIVTVVGEKATVSQIRLAFVSGMYISHQR
jgi:hypothetical protein